MTSFTPGQGSSHESGSSPYRAFSADGHATGWSTWDLQHEETLTLTWENEGWTATGHVGRENVQYVMRLSPLWQVRQFILFRDLEEPDLWLGTDGHGRWGEMNGAHRPELDGSTDIALGITPFTHAMPIRRLPLRVGDSAQLLVLEVDVDTLGVVPKPVIYTRAASHGWRVTDGDTTIEFDVDVHGLPVDVAGRFRSRQR